MPPELVQAVWVWRFTTAPFKATYGRLPGTTYSKDFLQAIRDCAEVLSSVFERSEGTAIQLQWAWPGGIRNGSLFEAGDYEENGRLDLRWETDNCPEPWRLFPDDDHNELKTFPGNPSHTTEADANAELEVLRARDLDPWLVVVKLFSESDVLHPRACLGRPPEDLAHTSVSLLPEAVRDAMRRVPSRGGCAVIHEERPVSDEGNRDRILFDSSRVHDAWSMMSMSGSSALRFIGDHEEAGAPRSLARRIFSRTYRPADVHPKTSAPKVFERDPDVVDRALQGHNVTQEKLAELVRAAGLAPGSSLGPSCDFDLAWESAGVVFVAEVKSLTGENERLQLRLGLGQVLEYAHRIRSEGWTVQPVLAVEREPADETWVSVCQDQGVLLVWPESMDVLFTTKPVGG